MQVSVLARLGHTMQRHPGAIQIIQWSVVVFYLVLLILPALLPHPATESRLFEHDTVWFDRIALFAQYLFWSVWWPFVIISILLLGRFWCGTLCPEGTLTEFASRHGRGGSIPKWIRWSGWPVLAFIATTIYGQLISVYDYPQAALLILGGSTVAAIWVGWMYGKGKRVWCRYLCPVSGVFALLARLSPIHFQVNRDSWERYPARTSAVDCAPLLNIKNMAGASQCHNCGRCSGYRDAVQLAKRPVNHEILQSSPQTAEAILLIYGLLGVAIGAFQWTISPWFVAIKQALAEWLLSHDILWPLQDSPAWWLLTHYPEVNDVFSWLDGACILLYIAGCSIVLGSAINLLLRCAAHFNKSDWRKLALGLTPIAGLGLFLGLSMMTLNHLRAEGIYFSHLAWMRGATITLASIWTIYLGNKMLSHWFALACFTCATGLITSMWYVMFFVW